MSVSRAFRVARWWIALLWMAHAQSAIGAEPAGKVVFSIGSTTATGTDSKARPLAKGAAVFEGDLINTGAGRIQLRFSDGGFLSLQPQTQFKLEKYHYAGKAGGADQGVFHLVKGGMRTITGLIGKNERKHYQVHTKVATIGVRGTEYSLNFDSGLQGSVASGQIDVCNSGGCSPFAQGESFIVPNAEIRPLLTLRKADLHAPQTQERKPKGPPGAPGQEGSGPPGAPGEERDAPHDASGQLGTAPPPTDQNGFVQGNATDESGTAIPFRLSGTHTLMAVRARYTSTGLFGLTAPFMTTVTLDDNGLATSIGTTTLSAVKGGSDALSAGGVGIEDVNGAAFHYVVGFPTLAPDIQFLKTQMPIGHYGAFKGTDPTGFFGTVAPAKETYIGKFLGGSLTADFAASKVALNMQLEILGKVLGVDAVNLNLTGTAGNTFSGPCNAGVQCAIDGFFVGPNAGKALLGYEFGGAPVDGQLVTGRGIAVFKKDP